MLSAFLSLFQAKKTCKFPACFRPDGSFSAVRNAFLNLVAWFFEPIFRHRFASCDHCGEVGTFEGFCADLQSYTTIRGLDGNLLEVGKLGAAFLRRTKLPLPRVSVPNMLGSVAFLSADLTNLRHRTKRRDYLTRFAR